ncbi:MAG: hypothetical protein R3B93_15875 [Bacteroidia bacterium]
MRQRLPGVRQTPWKTQKGKFSQEDIILYHSLIDCLLENDQDFIAKMESYYHCIVKKKESFLDYRSQSISNARQILIGETNEILKETKKEMMIEENHVKKIFE